MVASVFVQILMDVGIDGRNGKSDRKQFYIYGNCEQPREREVNAAPTYPHIQMFPRPGD